MGVETSFYIFCAINLAGAMLALFVLPETAGKTVEQIERELGKEKNTQDSVIWQLTKLLLNG